ncbi:DMT family transporter [Paenalcaligenes hermetiae]|uniref:DMT family transporter n=3 Tax=Paenalcaligenes TaxID=1100891 RepID=A0ABP9M3I4_9BURK
MWYLIMAFSAGAGMAMQAAVNSQLGKALFAQPLYAAFWSFASGTVLLFFLALAKGQLFQALGQIPAQPWWQLIGGLLGAGLVFSSVFLAPKLGVANMLFFMILGQLVFGLIIDSFGLFHMPVRVINWQKIVGVGLILSGLLIFFFAKK